MDQKFYDIMESNPVIAAVKNIEDLEKCLKSDLKVVFVLFGDITNIADIVKRIKASDKIAMIHIDLVIGLSTKEIVADFIKNTTMADGIISTKLNIIKRAKDLGLYTIYRLFAIDSMSLASLKNQQSMIKADFIEILPGTIPRVIKKVCKISSRPIIAGGLITEKIEVLEALEAGAIAISSTNQNVWFM